MKWRHHVSCRRGTAIVGAWALAFTVGTAAAQAPAEIADRMPEIPAAAVSSTDQVLEFGLGLGRYDYIDSDQTSAFNSQFVRYSRSRPWIDTWRVEVGRQHRLDDSSLDGGLSYTRFVGQTSLFAGIAGGTGDVVAPRYRLDLGVSRPIANVVARLGYTRIESKAENRSQGWSAGLTRWFGQFILSAGHRVDYGQPGDTRSSSTGLGVTWYQWRQTYVGAGVDFGDVSYQLVGPGVPVSSLALVDYRAWNLHLTLSQYLNDRSGFNLRYDHGQARDIWNIDGISAAYFREW